MILYRSKKMMVKICLPDRTRRFCNTDCRHAMPPLTMADLLQRLCLLSLQLPSLSITFYARRHAVTRCHEPPRTTGSLSSLTLSLLSVCSRCTTTVRWWWCSVM
ncbi:hypothetical protein Hanom_Chr04g00349901 [Helianthus anomalus]